AYPVRGGPAAEANVELLQDGKLVVRIPIPLAPADSAGRIKQVGRLPLDPLVPGTYELRAVVKQGTQQVSSFTILRIVD
ncbi:MAG: hypothetical protein ABJC89_14900, partial [Acidobacteriota bacterium]